jgi:hypothetical protein
MVNQMADCFTDEPVAVDGTPKPIILGVLGHRTDATQEKLVEGVMTPLLQELGILPERILLPSEGTSSIFLSDWAESLHIPTQIYEADWRRHQRRALIYRDARIQEEATHFVVFLNKRSMANEKTAMRLARKGHPVLTVTYADWSLEYITIEESTDHPEPRASSPQKSPHQTSWLGLPEEPDRKLGTGKGKVSRREKRPEDLGSQQTLREAWAT